MLSAVPIDRLVAPEPGTTWNAARRGRVWRHIERPSTAARLRPTRGAIGSGVAVASLIAAGLVGVTSLDRAETPSAPSDAPLGSMAAAVDQIAARPLWYRGITGAGVSVAVIDTGVADVASLSGSIVAETDFSTDQADATVAFLDGHGHGTHLAGIVAGHTPGRTAAGAASQSDSFMGVAPDAGIVSIKVAGRDGAVTESSVVSGIDWAIANQDRLNIGVIELALGTGSARDGDAIVAALERAWMSGIVVVTAAGNGGAAADGLDSPATAPFAIAVAGVEATEDGFVVPDWASRGNDVRMPDLAAPGAHIESLRAPGSEADVEHPEGYVDSERFLASGSSQATAMVAGAAALLLDAHPGLTPDEVKATLVASAHTLDADRAFVGAGLIDVTAAVDAPIIGEVQRWTPSDVERPAPVDGVARVTLQPSGNAWSGNAWSGNAWSGNAWSGNAWSGNAWSGNAWSGNAWSGNAWSGNAWSGNAWSGTSGNAWSGNAWSGNAWSGNAWSGNAWSGNAWSGNAWSGNAWSGNAWSGNAWSGNAWSGNAWSGNAWSGNAWSGNAWSGNAWSGNAWSGNAWSGNAWSGNAWS